MKTHQESFKLPKYELYEIGSQLRRSSQSIVVNIVEGYGRSRYKQEYIRFLVFAHASNNETLCHISCIVQLYPDINENFKKIYDEYDMLGAKINKYIQFVVTSWNDTQSK